MRIAAVLSVTALAYTCAAVALATVLLVQWDGADLETLINTVGFGTAFLGLPAVGAVLAIHRPANPIGRTLLAFGGGMYLMLFVGTLTEVEAVRSGAVDGALLWVAGLVSAAAPVLLWLSVHLVLYFPNGDLVGRARWVSRAATVVVVLVVAARLVRPLPLDAVATVANPYGQEWAGAVDRVVSPLTLVLVLLGLAALARLFARHRRAAVEERVQFRWILSALVCIPAALALGIVVGAVLGSDLAATVVIIGGYNLGTLGFAYALYRAVTKQDLYGIGRVVSRSVSYLLVVAVLAATYLVLVVGLGAAARAVTGETSDLVVALSTLAVAALSRPVRLRARSIVDRRFNRATYDAARTIDAFGRELRDEVSLDAVVSRLTDVSRGSFQPTVVGVLLVPGRQP